MNTAPSIIHSEKNIGPGAPGSTGKAFFRLSQPPKKQKGIHK